MSARSRVGCVTAALGFLVALDGCGQVRTTPGNVAGANDSGANEPGVHDNAGSVGDAGHSSVAGASSQGGQAPRNQPDGGASDGGANNSADAGNTADGGTSDGGTSDGGTSDGGATAGRTSGGGASNGGAGNDSSAGNGGASDAPPGGSGGARDAGGEGGASGANEVPEDIATCLANLVGPPTSDIVSVRGHAGVLGNVDYIIAGYSAGALGPDGIQRFTNGYYGQVGTPAGISDTGLWMWTQSGNVVVGKTYTSGYLVPGGAQLSFRIFANSYSLGVSCPVWGSGHFTFTDFQSATAGGYDFQCPEADIDVTGCFRYPN